MGRLREPSEFALSRRSSSATSRRARRKQVTDGLADAMLPAWDASGKYLWFLASTDFGLGSQWLDMTSYDHEETFGLYFAVLKKGEPCPLLPESDEDLGVGSAPAGRRPRCGRAADRRRRRHRLVISAAPRAPRAPVTRTDRLRWPAAAHPVGARRSRARSTRISSAGAAGMVYYLEAGAGGGARRRWWRRDAASLSPERSSRRGVCHGRRRVRRQCRRPQAAVSHAAAAAAAARRRRGAGRGPELFVVDADRTPPAAGQGRLDVTLRMYLEPQARSSSRSSTKAGAISATTST